LIGRTLADFGLHEEHSRKNRGPIVNGRGIDRFLPAHIRDDPSKEGIPYWGGTR